MWAGGNDWESGWTWIGIHRKGSHRGEEPPLRWKEIDRSKCPECDGTLNSDRGRKCMRWSKAEAEKWVRGVTTNDHTLPQETTWVEIRNDVSQEARDETGKWTKSGSGKAKKPVKAEVSAPPEPPKSAKALRAQASHHKVDKDIQRYAEEHNEPRFAKLVGGVSLPDGEPVDVGVALVAGTREKWQAEADRWNDVKATGKTPDKMELTGKAKHGVELKTMVDNKHEKLTMDTYAQIRKILWEKEKGATFHTVVSDDQQVKDALGPGEHDDSKRVYYYRRGIAGSARVTAMHRCKDEVELLKLMKTPEEKLPKAAQRTDGALRDGDWQEHRDEDGRKGFREKKTGRIVLAKK